MDRHVAPLGHIPIPSQTVFALSAFCELGDEFHYLFECTEFIHDRARLMPQKYRCSPNTVKYCALMCSNSVLELSKLCKFIRIANSKVCP